MSEATGEMGHLLPSLIRTAYPKHAMKRAAAAADVPLETARNWIRGRATPSAATLLRWADRCDAMAQALENLLHDRRAARTRGQVPASDSADHP